MKSIIRLIAALLVGSVALSGCSAVRTMFSGGSSVSVAPDEASAEEAMADAPVAAPSFILYDSWASW